MIKARITDTQAVGEELRRARVNAGLTREQLATLAGLHFQSLAAYERGTRQCTVGRFIELCRAMGVPAPDVLRWAMQRAELDLRLIGVQVDLRAVVADDQPGMGMLRKWAQDRLAEDPAREVVHLEWAAFYEMARLFGITHAAFLEYTPDKVRR